MPACVWGQRAREIRHKMSSSRLYVGQSWVLNTLGKSKATLLLLYCCLVDTFLKVTDSP